MVQGARKNQEIYQRFGTRKCTLQHVYQCTEVQNNGGQQTRQDNISVQVDHEGELLEQVHDFKFLGSYKSADGDCTKEIKRRIAMARQKAVVLASIWKDRKIKTATKVKVMKSMVWAVFEYGVEGWTLNKSDRNRIETFKMWFWRKMLSISWQEHRTND